jgi:hypothetical protein
MGSLLRLVFASWRPGASIGFVLFANTVAQESNWPRFAETPANPNGFVFSKRVSTAGVDIADHSLFPQFVRIESAPYGRNRKFPPVSHAIQ